MPIDPFCYLKQLDPLYCLHKSLRSSFCQLFHVRSYKLISHLLFCICFFFCQLQCFFRMSFRVPDNCFYNLLQSFQILDPISVSIFFPLFFAHSDILKQSCPAFAQTNTQIRTGMCQTCSPCSFLAKVETKLYNLIRINELSGFV